MSAAFAFNTGLRCSFTALVLALCSASSAGAAGVTIITHGFNSNVTDWIIPMAEKEPEYPGFPGSNYSCYILSITRNGSGQYIATATFKGGLAPLLTDSGEILVKLDWSTLSSFGGASTTIIAQTTVNALLATNLIPELGGRPLAELPMHLVGHSRGGSVIVEMARLLGAQGIWVDQVTTLDPRPVTTLGDPSVVTSWTNVLFADNFWQTMGDGLITPNGQSVFGAYNRKLLVLGGGYSSTHSDVHLWYHGTVDLATPTTDTQANITASERSTWWTSTETAGAAAGFFYSLIGGGDRLTGLEPGGVGTGRINDGFNKNWDLGGGVASNRTTLPANAGLWPNAIRFELEEPITIPAGASFGASLYHQAGATPTGNIDLGIFLDADFNPYNGDEIEVHQQMLLRTGTNAVSFNTLNATVNAGDVPPDTYAVCARVNDGTRTRYLYAPQLLVVTQPSPSPTPTPTPMPTPTSTPTPIPTPTPTPTPPPTVTLSGTLLYCSNPVPGPVPGVTLTLTGTSGGSILSDGSGNYTLSSLAAGGSYTVTPTKATRAPGSAGINTVDVVAVQRHFLNLGTPLSGCRVTAADVNSDTAVNTIDVIAVQRFFLGLTTGIAGTGQYQFSPSSRSYPVVGSDQTAQNYDVLIFGDVAAPFTE